MKYAVEIAKLGSINKAAEKLMIAQPNLSRAVKELEADLGISIFDRSSKGMMLTPDGEKFISYAKKILAQINEIENLYRDDIKPCQRFSISVPRACYISDAFSRFSSLISNAPAEIFYKETNSKRAIDNIINADYKLGIIRYAQNYDKYFKAVLEEKGLLCETVTEFHYVLVMSKDCRLAQKSEIRFSDLKNFVEIAHADPFVPSLSLAQVKKEELPDDIERRIYVFERASQFDLLSSNKDTFMWVSSVPSKLLERYDLVERVCAENKKMYKDVLIYKKDYKLTELDNKFIAELRRSKNEIFK